MKEHVVGIRTWYGGLFAKLHPRIFENVSGLAVVAGYARRNNVFPSMPTSSRSGMHMIEGEVFCLVAAVLTRISITMKDCPTRHSPTNKRTLHHMDEPYYRRDRNSLRYGAHLTSAV